MVCGLTKVRDATLADAPFLAEMILSAGGGMFEVLMEGSPAPLLPSLTHAVREPKGIFSYRQAQIAEDGGRLAGTVLTCPASWMREMHTDMTSADRHVYIDVLSSMIDPASYYIATLAVATDQQRRGLARPLLDAAFARARRKGYERVTLHVWARNARAVAVYVRYGFVDIGLMRVPPHPLLRHGDTMLLMRKRLTDPH